MEGENEDSMPPPIGDSSALEKAVKAADISQILKLLPSPPHPDKESISSKSYLTTCVKGTAVPDWWKTGCEDTILTKAFNLLRTWEDSITVGTKIDVHKPEEEGKWFECSVNSCDGDMVNVHYLYWPTKYDEDISRFSPYIAPHNTHTVSKKKVKKTTGKKGYVDVVLVSLEEEERQKKAALEALLQETGRSKRKRVEILPLPKPKVRPTKSKDKAKECEPDPAEGGWICASCFQFDAEDGSALLLCDGGCMRSYHLGCLDLTPEDVEGEEKWLCQDCSSGCHTCALCGDEGEDNEEDGVFRCQVPKCGYYYHQQCIEMSEASRIRDDGRFTCPRHVCDTCEVGVGCNAYDKKKASGYSNKDRASLIRCFMCPVAYHIQCIPPNARFHELALLCYSHKEASLPRLKESILETESGVVFVPLDKDGKSALPSLDFPKRPPPANNPDHHDHFRLPTSVLDAYNEKPPHFDMLRALRWECPQPPRQPPGESCVCVGECNDRCINRLLHVECVSAKTEEAKASGILSRYENCSCGPKCGNRRFQQHQRIKTITFREPGRGWGLKAADPVPRGELVLEYVGEVIDEETMHERLELQKRDRPNDKEHYVMELEPGGPYVDAKFKGGLSRLINHSCDPNCELQRWNVMGMTRIGIFAVKDIEAGESLSYDYQFDTNEESKFVCRCGTAKCRGTLKSKSRKELDEARGPIDYTKAKGKLRKDLVKKAVRREKGLEQKKLVSALNTRKRLSLTGRGLPGESTSMVEAGPKKKFFDEVRYNAIFLPRTTRIGFDFVSRKAHLQAKGRRLLARREAARAARASTAGGGSSRA